MEVEEKSKAKDEEKRKKKDEAERKKQEKLQKREEKKYVGAFSLWKMWFILCVECTIVARSIVSARI